MTDQTERRRPRWRIPVIAGTSIALALGTAATAFALVSPSPNTNTIGAGGYDVGTPGITGNQEVLNADQYGLTLAGGNQGVKMCNSTSDFTSAIGEHSGNLSTDYSVQYGVGVAPNCEPAGQVPAGDLNTYPGLDAVPFGHHVWVNESLVTKTKTVRILICILYNRQHKPVPTPTPSVGLPTSGATTAPANPTAPATGASTTGPANPTAPATGATTTTSAPTVAPATATPTPTPTKTYTQDPGLGGVPVPLPVLPGFSIRCKIITKTFTVNKIVFEAQDLDAPTATPTAGDLPGDQIVSVPVPAGTTFDHSAWGASENTTALVACTGSGFPIAINTPGQTANYASAACQPLSVGEYATYNTGPTVNPLNPAGTPVITEVISPSAGGATMAPNGSLTSTNLGPHGTASDASTTGGHFVTFSANAPVS